MTNKLIRALQIPVLLLGIVFIQIIYLIDLFVRGDGESPLVTFKATLKGIKDYVMRG